MKKNFFMLSAKISFLMPHPLLSPAPGRAGEALELVFLKSLPPGGGI